ncbi:MAG: CDP-diacylglycerol--glycerol-3-phosphate 3-phosphatidyltransferase [Firmicutes bacterium]|nr:CDP-diacylglycerol--glycerol-3-phosphate 3-phosphatidyltransferase [Bacillota bacterium]
MNLPNKITIGRLILSFIVLILLLMPWYSLGIEWPEYLVNNVLISSQYIVAGILFAVAAFTDFLDGYLARKLNQVTDFGKVADAIADKALVNGVLIILACNTADLNVIVPVVIITRDIIVDSLKMLSGNKGKVVAASKLGKLKTICMLLGITLIFFKNIPFEFIDLPVADFFIILGTIFSVVSACQYYYNIKDLLFEKERKSKK